MLRHACPSRTGAAHGAARGRILYKVFMTPSQKLTERALTEMAVELASSSKSEDEERIHPKVGAVVARDGHVLSTGYRGELYEGAHAEESALFKLKVDEAIGATVYS